MYYYFWRNTKVFWAIIIGAVIIGGFVYAGLRNSEVVVAPKIQSIGTSDIPIVTNVGRPQDAAECGAANQTIVTKVIDGDTVVVEGGFHVRMLGMDADETGYPCYEPAKTRLEALVLGKQVELEKDITDLDQYGRCLRYIFIGSENVDAQMVKDGMAIARFYAPDIKYKNEIAAAELQAQAGEIGCKWQN